MRYRMHIAALLCGVLVGVAGCSGSGPEGAVRKFHQALDKGDLSAARGQLDAQLVGMLGERKIDTALASIAQKYSQCGGVKKIEVDLEGEGDVRYGESRVEFKGDCEVETEKVRVIKKDDKWVLSGEK